MEHLKRAVSPFRFRIPADLIPKLRKLRATQPDCRALLEAEDVVHLFYGLGPALFLTMDGRVLVDNQDWNGKEAYEVSDPKKACQFVSYSAFFLNFPELLQILPPRPHEALDCPRCGGTGWLIQLIEKRQGVVCEEYCGGLGWVTNSDAGR